MNDCHPWIELKNAHFPFGNAFTAPTATFKHQKWMSDHVLSHKNGLACRMIMLDNSVDRYDSKEDSRHNCGHVMSFEKIFTHSKVKHHVVSKALFEAKLSNFDDFSYKM